MVDINAILDNTAQQAAYYIPKLAYAIVVLIIGLLLI